MNRSGFEARDYEYAYDYEYDSAWTSAEEDVISTDVPVARRKTGVKSRVRGRVVFRGIGFRSHGNGVITVDLK